MQFVLMRWRGPLMSLAGARIDNYAQQMPIPSVTMVAGMLGAALGYRRGDDRLEQLADGLSYGVVVHRPGTPLIDYQTADLAKLGTKAVAVDPDGRIRIVKREGSAEAVQGTAQQWRPLLADADMSVVAAVHGYASSASLESLREPVFPLCLGRVSCPPTGRVGERVIEAESLDAALNLVRESNSGTVYRPAVGLTEGLVVSIPARGRGAALFSVEPVG
jgi:CRISPR system Cascade subunit CasD